jgi:transposase
MIEVRENRLIFAPEFVYCHDCSTEMAFNGRIFECPRCGPVYKYEKVV